MEQKKDRKIKISKYDLIFFIGILAVLALYLYKIPLEIRGNDEAFYLTIPQRILQGDIFIVNEWHGSQLSALLIAPFMAIRNLFCSANDGIVLQFRYIYVFVHMLTSCLLYSRLRRYKASAVIASLIFFLFTPYDITALSYNTIGIGAVCLAMVFLATAHKRLDYILSGFFFSAGVLCCPFLLLAFAVGIVAIVIYGIVKKEKTVFINIILFAIGCVPLMIALFGIIFSGTSVSGLIESIPNLLTDPEHPSYTIIGHIKNYLIAFYRLFYAVVPGAILALVCIVDKNKAKRKTIYFSLGILISIAMLVGCIVTGLSGTYNFIVMPIAFAGLIAFLLLEEKDIRLFAFMYVGAFLYSFSINMGSNQKLYIISCTLSIATVAGVVFIFRYIAENAAEARKSTKQLIVILAAVLICSQTLTMGYVKATHKFWSSNKNSELTEVIEEGPYAGIKVTPKAKEEYNHKLECVRNAINDTDSRLLVYDDTTWYYLNFRNVKISAFSAWLSGISNNATIDRLAAYYELNPDKTPDIIYIPSPDEVDFDYLGEKLLKGRYEIVITSDYTIMHLKESQQS